MRVILLIVFVPVALHAIHWLSTEHREASEDRRAAAWVQMGVSAIINIWGFVWRISDDSA